eukprot:1139018-Pelagomonas_calceolata.AAC.12
MILSTCFQLSGVEAPAAQSTYFTQCPHLYFRNVLPQIYGRLKGCFGWQCVQRCMHDALQIQASQDERGGQGKVLLIPA